MSERKQFDKTRQLHVICMVCTSEERDILMQGSPYSMRRYWDKVWIL
ncbi:hypothetical protein [Paenibacillus sp. TC-CSREp1]